MASNNSAKRKRGAAHYVQCAARTIKNKLAAVRRRARRKANNPAPEHLRTSTSGTSFARRFRRLAEQERARQRARSLIPKDAATPAKAAA